MNTYLDTEQKRTSGVKERLLEEITHKLPSQDQYKATEQAKPVSNKLLFEVAEDLC